MGSNPIWSTTLRGAFEQVGATLGGLVAGEGSFCICQRGSTFKAGGAPRLKFVFKLTLAQRDLPLLVALHEFLGAGAIYYQRRRKVHWLDTASVSVTSMAEHERAVIPFGEAYLLPATAKWRQFVAWRDVLRGYRFDHPPRTRSVCSIEGCTGLVRGRMLCRHHYHLATGY